MKKSPHTFKQIFNENVFDTLDYARRASKGALVAFRIGKILPTAEQVEIEWLALEIPRGRDRRARPDGALRQGREGRA